MSAHPGHRHAPSPIWYLFAIALILAGVAVAVVPNVFLAARLKDRSPPVQFAAPGHKEIVVREPGDYTLWNDYQTVFEGKSYYTSSNSLPNGLEIKLLKKDTGQVQEMKSRLHEYVTTPSTASRSVGRFTLQEPGTYELSITTQTPHSLVFSFSKDWMLEFFGKLFGFALLGLTSVLAGAIIGFTVLIKRNKS